MGAQRFDQPRGTGDFRRFAIERQRRDALREFGNRILLHLCGEKRHQYFGDLAGKATLERRQRIRQATRQKQGLLTRKGGAQGLDLTLMLAKKPRRLGFVERLRLPAPVLATRLESGALFFFQRDDVGHLRLHGGSGGRRFGPGFNGFSGFNGFGDDGAAMISTAASSIWCVEKSGR